MKGGTGKRNTWVHFPNDHNGPGLSQAEPRSSIQLSWMCDMGPSTWDSPSREMVQNEAIRLEPALRYGMLVLQAAA